jgi:hypothetical protein
MKIKLVEPGYEGFTGIFGTIEFLDGVSVDHVSRSETYRLASLIRIEDAEGGPFAGIAADAAARNATTQVVTLPTLAEVQAAEAAAKAATEAAPVVVVPEQVTPDFKAYTQAELEGIADKSGIAGLREIADPMNIKGTSVAKLIEQIVAAQTPVEQPTVPQEADKAAE